LFDILRFSPILVGENFSLLSSFKASTGLFTASSGLSAET
jgi:hypothetical protein